MAKKKLKVEKLSKHHKRIVELDSDGDELETSIEMVKPVSYNVLKKMSLLEIRDLLPANSLDDGSHDDPGTFGNDDAKLCLMEAVAFITGEEHSDRPKCACPVLTSIGINFNDSHGGDGDEQRDELIAAIPALVGSRTKSGRVRWRRAKRYTQLVLAMVLNKMSDELGGDRRRDPDGLADNLIQRLTRESRFKTRDDVRSIARDLELFGSEGTADIALTALDALAKNWKPDKMGARAYESIFADGDVFSELFEDGAAQAEFLRELGNIR